MLTEKVKKGQVVQQVNIAYTPSEGHKFIVDDLRGDCASLRELIINGDSYKIQSDEKGNYSLIRFNEKYKMWAEIKFDGLPKDVKSTITDVLKKQYIDRILSKGIKQPWINITDTLSRDTKGEI